MASIHTESEQRFIELLLRVKKPYIPYFWIGLKRNEDDFVWSDGSPLDYTNWYQGEPSRIINGFSNCIEIWDKNSWKWDVRDW